MIKLTTSLFSILLIGAACASGSEPNSSRVPAQSDSFTKNAEGYMEKLVAAKETKKVMTCFDSKEIGPINTIDIYQTTDLNMHCIGAFRDKLKNAVTYRKVYGCWPTDISNKPLSPFATAKKGDKLSLTVEGNYSAMEVVNAVATMELAYHVPSKRFLGVLKGVPDAVDFSESGSCAEVR